MPKRLGLLALAALALWALPAHGQNATLPEGGGKELVEAHCAQCHGLSQIVRSGYTRAGWQNTVAMMVNAGAKLTPEQAGIVTDYLAKNFPEKPMPAAALLSGSAKVTIKEWPVPTAGSRPHDPLATPDGSIWYTGQMADVLGRLDPVTGAIKEYRLPPDSGPHGLVADRDGNIWYTANFKGYIGKLDPKTGHVTEYRLPDPAARDPHTPLFDHNGILWFTVQGANMVGRLDPATGAIKLETVPTPRSNPYGMVISSKNVPFFVEFGSYKIASIDPQTMAIHEYPLPWEGARPRRVAITSDDVLWYSDYARGYLGRFDPKTGKAEEWASPGGPKSRPYGITQIAGIIWYSESGVSPNTIVRFDPKTEKFQTWAIPSGGDVVRNMMPTKDGNIAIACSGANRVGLVEIH
ncbi:MAG: cytochrome C [Candidatus Eremiobacteraeota bacterium]|nr:cytochrome C [Candidatus Eremiobacteraeota bacterium]